MPITKASSSAVAPAAKGQLVVGSATNDSAILAVGANATVLTADSAEATGMKWATAGGGGANWSLLNAGGTSMAGSVTITVSGISAKDKIMLIVDSADNATSNEALQFRINGDTGANYNSFGGRIEQTNTYQPTMIQNVSNLTDNQINVCNFANVTDSVASAYCLISGGATAGHKIYNYSGGATAGGGGRLHTFSTGGGFWANTNTITSVSVKAGGGTAFTSGTFYVYTSA
jgi:hypothetical protein